MARCVNGNPPGLVSILFILILAACGPKPEEVALELAEAVNAQDVDQALTLFSEDAVVTSVSPEPFRGKAEIQGWLEGMIADDFKLEAEIAEVSGNKVIEHDTMTMQALEPGVGEGYTCTPDEVGVYFVRWEGDDLDRLKFEVINDPCGVRMGGMMWGLWKPVTLET